MPHCNLFHWWLSFLLPSRVSVFLLSHFCLKLYLPKTAWLLPPYPWRLLTLWSQCFELAAHTLASMHPRSHSREILFFLGFAVVWILGGTLALFFHSSSHLLNSSWLQWRLVSMILELSSLEPGAYIAINKNFKLSLLRLIVRWHFVMTAFISLY